MFSRCRQASTSYYASNSYYMQPPLHAEITMGTPLAYIWRPWQRLFNKKERKCTFLYLFICSVLFVLNLHIKCPARVAYYVICYLVITPLWDTKWSYIINLAYYIICYHVITPFAISIGCIFALLHTLVVDGLCLILYLFSYISRTLHIYICSRPSTFLFKRKYCWHWSSCYHWLWESNGK